MPKDLTASVYQFEDMRVGNFLYVDKTEYLWKMLQPYKAMYFLSRPRRFGKSLTLSTLKAIFQGKKELFKGLAIYDKPYDWKEYPIIHLDNGNCNGKNAAEVREYLHAILDNVAMSHHLKLRGVSLSTDFQFLIEDLAKETPVVILLDEYDKPMLNVLSTPEAKEVLSVLKGFYSSIKTCDRFIRFAFITGVTKFCHVSLFSDLNNLLDITMHPQYATMLGYTQEELEANFSEWLDEAESKQELPHDAFMAKIKQWYDGFRFHAKAESVYNPVSLTNFFLGGGEFHNYWFSTGTPTFLIDLVKRTHFDFEELLSKPVPELAFSAFEVDKLNPLTLLVQTGYLTIGSAFEQFGLLNYNLTFPNLEVTYAFETYLLEAYTQRDKAELQQLARQLAVAVMQGQVDEFMEMTQNFFAKIPYDLHLKQEKYYQTIFYTLFVLLGVSIEAEARTNKGRIDAVATYGDWCYIFEFKLQDTAENALAQIESTHYYQKYRNCGRQIVLIGAAFDGSKGELTQWVTKRI